jgi:Ni,Fe-hydrogenase maturation factor
MSEPEHLTAEHALALLRPEGLSDVNHAIFVDAQDMHYGDVFCYRDEVYLTLSCTSDRRTTHTIVTAIHHSETTVLFQSVTILRLFRTLPINVLGRLKLEVTMLESEGEEITPEMLAKLERLRAA